MTIARNLCDERNEETGPMLASRAQLLDFPVCAAEG